MGLLGALLIAVSLPPQQSADTGRRIRFLLLEVLHQTEPRLRKDAIKQLSKIGEEAAPLIVRYLEEKHRKGPLQRLIDGLVRALDDDDLATREVATVRLVEMGARALPSVKKALRSRSAEVRARAKDILAAIERLPKRGPDSILVEADLLYILSRIGNRTHLEWVIVFFKHEESRMRLSAVEAWSRLATRRDLETLKPALTDKAETVRSLAIKAVAAVGRGEAVPQLLRIFEKEKNDQVRQAALNAVFGMHALWDKDVPDRILETAARAKPSAQGEFLRRLLWTRKVQGDFLARFHQRVVDSPRQAKTAVLRALALRPSTLHASLVVILCGNKDADVRKAARATVAAMAAAPRSGGTLFAQSRMFAAILEAVRAHAGLKVKSDVVGILYGRGLRLDPRVVAVGLASPDAEFAMAAAAALENAKTIVTTTREGIQVRLDPIEEKRAAALVPQLRSLLARPPNKELRTTYALLLGRLGDPSGRALVGTALDSKEAALRARAARAAGTLKMRESLPRLIELSRDDDASVRAAALGALAEVPDPSTVKPALARLSDRDGNVRAMAVRVVGRSETAEHVPAISALAGDRSAAVQAQLVVALEKLPLPAAPDAIRMLASKGHVTIRHAAKAAVSRMDRRKDVQRRLEELRSDQIPVRFKATRELLASGFAGLRYRLEKSSAGLAARPFAEDGSVRVAETVLVELLLGKDSRSSSIAEEILARAATEAPSALLEKLKGAADS